MSRQREADSLWSIMEQSEWWKQYSMMVNEEKAEDVPTATTSMPFAFGSGLPLGSFPSSLPSSLPFPVSGSSSGSGILGYGLQLL